MITLEELASGTTLAEAQGMTEELGRAAARLAGAELEAGRLETAREILEGLAVTNPHDPAPWAMLALVARRRGRLLAARVCAETAYRLAPEDAQVRLVRAEVLLCDPEERGRARAELAGLAGAEATVAARARALLTALG
ncbi:tetratricopeptide repeat protein [Anaeromyxobacter diazotrophicus]|uniref:tetratricopeptide repeat protein n=1 Tax=Anaeromyxobacter diazotrophicus TaxID=2590199 RepID=UPI001F25C54D|nr:tetratricopeptide repeat protein [Anaeromyxobacter diazotrophicus]